ncbi:hypothetical protein Bca52824_094866 [Brassica carinata]|uniref:Prolyl endopeptidase n=1 Tax=Brassica carinata TaxID=52824 RepID=A0A8X7P2Y7_BRACI|nr:hypothetical protein Bca52824_094866 [Brassica carinata]
MLKAFAQHARSQVFAFVTVPATRFRLTRRLRINILRKSSSSSRQRSLLQSTRVRFSRYCSSSSSRPSSAIMGSSSVLGELLHYPLARRDDSVVEDYHGVKIADPYRWLEDPDAEEVKEFVQNQVKLTDSVLEKCETKEKLRQNITALFDHPRYDSPFRRGDKYFYFHNTGLQAQDVLYMQDDLDAEAVVLLDPNTLSDDGTVALNTFSVSEDAKYLAYGLSSSGSDWVTIKLIKIEDKKVEPDTLSWVKFSGITWTHDSKGFFYGRYPAPKDGEDIDAGTETNSNLYHELYYHFLGTDQSQDILCWRDSDNPKYMFGAEVTDDGKFLIMSIEEGCDPVNKLYYCDLSSLSGGLESFRGSSSFLPFIKLVDTLDAQYSIISNDETLFTFLTNKDAPKYKLVRVDLKEPNSWTDVVEEHEKDVLAWLILVQYLMFLLGKDNTFFFSFTSFLTPVYSEVAVPGFDREAFQPLSKDRTKIPMFIVAKKDIKLDGSHPCLLYAYGGFNISITPSFSASRIVLSKHLGAVFCIANIRCGFTCQQAELLDDFISGAEYLVSAGYTQPSKLSKTRPFGCALAHVGVMDMLRFHKFTIGHAWTTDYGCSENEEEFHWLIKYSPLHNVKRPWEQHTGNLVQYPSTMLLTADHDDRVVPLHSLKLLATLQHVLCTSLENSPQTNPIIGRIEVKAGHGAEFSMLSFTSYNKQFPWLTDFENVKQIDEAADRYSFMAKMVNAPWTE